VKESQKMKGQENENMKTAKRNMAAAKIGREGINGESVSNET
jgi:hypothetical protein